MNISTNWPEFFSGSLSTVKVVYSKRGSFPLSKTGHFIKIQTCFRGWGVQNKGNRIEIQGLTIHFFCLLFVCFFRNCPIQGLFTLDLIWMIITKEVINKTWASSIQTNRASVCLGSAANNYFNALLFIQFGDQIQKFSLYVYLFGEQFLYGNSVSPYSFPLPAVLLYIVFMTMIFIISYSISLYRGKKHHLTFILCS